MRLGAVTNGAEDSRTQTLKLTLIGVGLAWQGEFVVARFFLVELSLRGWHCTTRLRFSAVALLADS